MPAKRKNPFAVEEIAAPIKKRKYTRKPKRKTSEVAQLKRLIVRLIKKFEKDLAHPEEFNEFWGEKESPVNVITKLSQILLKLFSIADPKSAKPFSAMMKEEFSEEDFAILADFAASRNI